MPTEHRPADPLPEATPAPPARALFPKLMVSLVLVVTLLMVALIYWRWFYSRFPTSYLELIPAPGESVEGAEVTVANETEGGEQVAKVEMHARAPGDTPGVPVVVEPGIHTVTTRYQGVVVDRQRISVPHRRIVPVNITTRPSVDDDPRNLLH